MKYNTNEDANHQIFHSEQQQWGSPPTAINIAKVNQHCTKYSNLVSSNVYVLVHEKKLIALCHSMSTSRIIQYQRPQQVFYYIAIACECAKSYKYGTGRANK